MSCHPYQGQDSPESGKWVDMAGSVKEMLKENGWDDIKVWVTEANTSSSNQYNTAEGQGWNLVRHYALIDAYNVVDTFISYQFQTNELSKADNEARFGTVHRWGVDNAYGAKPAFLFASNFFAMTEGASFEKIIQEDNTYILRYKKEDGTDVFMMYANRDTVKVNLDLGSESGIMYDKYGNPTEIFGMDGIYTFVLDDAPIYFETKAEKFEMSQNEKIRINSVNEELPIGQTADLKLKPIQMQRLMLSQRIIIRLSKVKTMNSISHRRNVRIVLIMKAVTTNSVLIFSEITQSLACVRTVKYMRWSI
ncbi:MAG: hypothetical protein SOX82_01300 [Eubacteriales bacterium]|nr:hypothetical protein [Eubacteriales bacterium]